MTVENIIKAVRWCFDEENSNPSSLADSTVLDSDSTLMNNIIKSKIGDALRWVCLYAPPELLRGTDETGVDTGILREARLGPGVTYNDFVLTIHNDEGYGEVTMPDTFLRLVRIRADHWHRAVLEPISEDSDEYLQLRDENGAQATFNRPQAALINTLTKRIEAWPMSNQYGGCSVTVICDPVTNVDPTTQNPPNIAIPPNAKSAFIYYIAFLTLSAYEDSRSVRMLEIARMNLTRTEITQKK